MIGDRYELDRKIGRGAGAGGTATAWVGRDVVLGGNVAMRRLESVPDATEVAEQQARLSSQVRHPNVVAVYDLVDDDEHRWLVMEHVDGATLAELCDGSPLAPGRVAVLMVQVADALAAAHANGIVHGGLKPSNVLVTDADVAKLGDFGIARPDDDASLAYRAPELARTSTVGETTAADVWSFGATLYHACTGTPPHDGATLPEHHPLSEVVELTTAPDPADRPDMASVAVYLRDVAEAAQDAAGVDGPHATDTDGTVVPPTVLRRLHPTGPDGDETLSAAVARLLPATGPGAQVTKGLRTVTIANAVVLVGLGLVAVLGSVQAEADETPAPRTSAASAQVEPETATDARPPASAGTIGADGPTVRDVESFARRYVDTALRDPDLAYRTLLTRDLRVLSGPVEEFQPFWAAGITDVSIGRMSADARVLRATFIARYAVDGTERTATVVLRLVHEGDQLLLDGVEAV